MRYNKCELIVTLALAKNNIKYVPKQKFDAICSDFRKEVASINDVVPLSSDIHMLQNTIDEYYVIRNTSRLFVIGYDGYDDNVIINFRSTNKLLNIVSSERAKDLFRDSLSYLIMGFHRANFLLDVSNIAYGVILCSDIVNKLNCDMCVNE